MVEVYVNMASAQPRVHDEPDNKSQRTPHSAQGEPNDELVEYLKDRFPKRFMVLRYVAGNINCYGTAYKRLLHYKLINGTLRDLGMGTDRNERHERSVPFNDSTINFKVMDVVCAMKCSKASFEGWRKELRAANATLEWMKKNRQAWDDGRDGTVAWKDLWEALSAFFGPGPLPPRMRVEEEAETPEAIEGTVAVVPEAEEDVTLPIQRARGWSAKGMMDEVRDLWEAFGLNRDALPNWEEMVL